MARSLRAVASSLLRVVRGRAARTRIGYVIPVGGEARDWIRDVEMRLRDRYGANPSLEEAPHITLKQAFEVEAVEPFERHLDRLAAEVEPFEIVLRGIGVFERGIVFLDVAPEPRLEALRLKVLHELSTQFGIRPYALEDARYHFHATLAYGLPDAAAAEARRDLEAEGAEFRLTLEALALLRRTDAGWVAHARPTAPRTGPRPEGRAGPEPGR